MTKRKPTIVMCMDSYTDRPHCHTHNVHAEEAHRGNAARSLVSMAMDRGGAARGLGAWDPSDPVTKIPPTTSTWSSFFIVSYSHRPNLSGFTVHACWFLGDVYSTSFAAGIKNYGHNEDLIFVFNICLFTLMSYKSCQCSCFNQVMRRKIMFRRSN
jgi:hypothetical protein